MGKKFYSSFVDLYPDHSKMLKLSLDYYSGEKSIRESEYAKQRDDFEANYKKLLLDLWKNSSEKQRAFFKNRLSVIIDEINKELD